MSNPTYNTTLSAAREAAWNGDHKRAIALCSDALSSAQLNDAIRLDFHDTRAECSIAQGRLRSGRTRCRGDARNSPGLEQACFPGPGA